MSTKKNWIEATPQIDDTVKIEFASYTGLGAQIGIVVSVGAWVVIDFGAKRRWFDKLSTPFYVYK